MMNKTGIFLTIAIVGMLILVTGCPRREEVAPAPTPTPTPAPTPAPTIIPSVTVSDQQVSDSTVTIAQVVSDGPGWLVVHADADGKPGTVIGHTGVSEGTNSNVVVSLDVAQATPQLHAMLHEDQGQIGVYEFPGPDAPDFHEGQIVNVPFQASTPAAAPAQAAAAVKDFTITARQWQFDPSTITVQQGDMVKLSIQSMDVTHGFSLSAFGINEQLSPGKTVNIEFVADKKGTFPFACSVVCGSGHTGMRGTLVVE